MRYSIRFRFLTFLFCCIALAVAYDKSKTEAAMLDTANRFLQSLTPEQKTATLLDLTAKIAAWHYYPERGYVDEYKHDRRESCSRR